MVSTSGEELELGRQNEIDLDFASTAVTQTVYRHQLRPVITKGAETMNTIFSQHEDTKSA